MKCSVTVFLSTVLVVSAEGLGLKEIAGFLLGGEPYRDPYPGNYPNGGGNYPIGGGNYPIGGGNYPIGGGNYPIGGGNYPTGGGVYPTGGGNYPTGGGNYPTGGGNYPGAHRPPGPPGAHPGCPLCDSSVYSYCSRKQAHDACCCENPAYLPYNCRSTDCRTLYANSCKEYSLITKCCCVDLQRTAAQQTHVVPIQPVLLV